MCNHQDTLSKESALNDTYATAPWLDPARYDIIPPCYGPSPCGVIYAPSPTSCPDCRDVPESDIDSSLTEWECVCGGACQACHAILCLRRQIQRTIARLVAIQYEIALVIREILFLGVVYKHEDKPSPPGLPGRTIRYMNAASLAVMTPPFPVGIPDEIKIEACSIENCVYAIATTSPMLAWLAEGMPIKFRELDIVPNPNKHIVFQHASADVPDPSAKMHTVMIFAPDTDKDRTNDPNWHPGIRFGDIYDEGAHIGDPSYRQYDYDQNCHPTAAYLWEKVKEDPDNRVRLFGESFGAHRYWMAQTHNIGASLVGYVREAGICTANTSAHREFGLLGGSHQFTVSSCHDEFKGGLQRLVYGVRADLKRLRAEVDHIFSSFGPQSSIRQKQRDLEELIGEFSKQGHFEMMEAFHRRTNNAAPLLPVHVDQVAVKDSAAWRTKT